MTHKSEVKAAGGKLYLVGCSHITARVPPGSGGGEAMLGLVAVNGDGFFRAVIVDQRFASGGGGDECGTGRVVDGTR